MSSTRLGGRTYCDSIVSGHAEPLLIVYSHMQSMASEGAGTGCRRRVVGSKMSIPERRLRRRMNLPLFWQYRRSGRSWEHIRVESWAGRGRNVRRSGSGLGNRRPR